MTEISPAIFNEKLTKADIYKVCFAVVIFSIDYKGKMKSSTDEENKMFDVAYGTEEKIPNYILHYILKMNLSNTEMRNFIPVIFDWYSKGVYSKRQLDEAIELVNTYSEDEHPLFLSDEQIIEESNNFNTFIKSIRKDITFKNFMHRLDELASITENTKLELNISSNEVEDWVVEKYGLNDMYSMALFETILRKDSEFVKDIIPKLIDRIKRNNKEHIINTLKENFKKVDFQQSDIENATKFKDYFTASTEQERLNLVDEMKNNQWFFPLPVGEISYSHWTYCHSIFTMIRTIDRQLEKSLLDEYKEFCEQQISISSDEIFKYRMRHLIKQYITEIYD